MTTAVSSMPAASSPLRAGRAAAYGAVTLCGAAFAVGLVLWARDDEPLATHWALPSTWSDADLRQVTDEVGVPIHLISTYVMLLETLLATAGLVAAALLLRGAWSWFRLYIAVALALWVTLGGAMAVVYEDALGGAAGAGALALQGIGWLAVFPAAYLFPDGRFVPSWTRWVVLAWPTYFLFLLTLALLGHESDPESLTETVPLLVLFGSALFAAVHRYRKVATEEQRRQTRGVVAAIALWFAVALVSVAPPMHGLRAETTVPGLVANGVLLLAGYLAAALLPAAVAVAVLRHRLYEVDTWVSRTLVYAVLTALIVLTYAAFAALGGIAWSGDHLAPPLIATVVIAVVLHPVRLRVQRLVDRFVYGRRKERYDVLADLGRQLEAVVPADQVLRTLAREVGRALKLPYVAAAYGGVRVVQPDGAERPPGREHVFPIRWQDDELGDLTVVVRPGDELSVADRDLLDGLTRQAGAAVRAATLNDDLRRSRERILVAREDERRRLQRDLHDGLGPTLASLYQRVDAARALLGRDPVAAEALLLDVGEQTKLVIAEIRRLVRGLRPPELDELGLVGSVRAAAARFDAMTVTVDASRLPDMPPVVAIAAYRIVTEALTNAARHAGARSASVCLDTNGDLLIVTVTDDGRGLVATDPAGTGLRSMRERADELGGTCGLQSPPTGGTQVRAALPLTVTT